MIKFKYLVLLLIISAIFATFLTIGIQHRNSKQLIIDCIDTELNKVCSDSGMMSIYKDPFIGYVQCRDMIDFSKNFETKIDESKVRHCFQP